MTFRPRVYMITAIGRYTFELTLSYNSATYRVNSFMRLRVAPALLLAGNK